MRDLFLFIKYVTLTMYSTQLLTLVSVYAVDGEKVDDSRGEVEGNVLVVLQYR